MNERVMQFRIGMFVIVAGLVLTMLIVWFESPALFKQRQYVTVFFREAPGINQGVPVRKSGVRIGEVADFTFVPADAPEDGVLVTLSLDPEFPVRAGTIPKLSRALIGDVSIDLMPGDGAGELQTFDTVDEAMKPENHIRGIVATDPFVLLTSAADTFEQANATLESIRLAADSLDEVAQRAVGLEDFLDTWGQTGKRLDALAEDIQRVVRDNEDDFGPTVASAQNVFRKLEEILTEEAQEDVRQSFANVAAASAKFDSLLTELEPTARDLRAGPGGEMPKTNLGQTFYRMNRVAYDVSLLTGQLGDGQGRLNTNGTLQRLVTDPALYDNLNATARSADSVIRDARVMVRSLGTFAEKIARQPSLIGEGVLSSPRE